MKKLLLFGVFLVFSCAGLYAQGMHDRHFRSRLRDNLTAFERFELRRDNIRLHTLQRRALRDGIVTPYERRAIRRMKIHNRIEGFRFRHNDRRRFI